MQKKTLAPLSPRHLPPFPHFEPRGLSRPLLGLSGLYGPVWVINHPSDLPPARFSWLVHS